MKQVFLSYHDIHTDCIKLAKIIKKKYKPEKLILISRGGLIPGSIIANYLGIQDIDEAIVYYIENIIKPTVIQNGIVQKVPIIYGSAERWKQLQKDGFLKDAEGKTMLPFITFKRDSIDKNRSITNKLDSNFPNNYYIFTKTYNKKDVYDKFSILNNRKPTKEYYVVVVPDYVTVTYSFIVGTYYIEQMNKIVEAINYASDSYWGNPERFKFKASIDSFSHAVEVVSSNERAVKTTFSVKLYGYIVPDNVQKQLSSIKKYSDRNYVVFNSEIAGNLESINNAPSGTFSSDSPYII